MKGLHTAIMLVVCLTMCACSPGSSPPAALEADGQGLQSSTELTLTTATALTSSEVAQDSLIFNEGIRATPAPSLQYRALAPTARPSYTAKPSATSKPFATPSPTLDVRAEAALHAQRALGYYATDASVDAEKEASLALALDEGQVDALLILGLLAYQNRQYGEAVGFYTRLIALEPESQRAYYQRALALEADGSPDAALDDYNRCAELSGEQDLSKSCLTLAQSIQESLVTPTPTPTVALQPANEGYTCNQCIKGNINSEGEHIYHFPGCASYEKTKISTDKGERWFSSEGEALAAGWRRALNCP